MALVVTPQNRLKMILFLPMPLIAAAVLMGYVGTKAVHEDLRRSLEPRVNWAQTVGEIRPAWLAAENRLLRVAARGALSAGDARIREAMANVSSRIDAAGETPAEIGRIGSAPRMKAELDRLRTAWDRYRNAISEAMSEAAMESPGEGTRPGWDGEAVPRRKGIDDALTALESHARTEAKAGVDRMENRLRRNMAMLTTSGAMSLLIWLALSAMVLRAENPGGKRATDE